MRGPSIATLLACLVATAASASASADRRADMSFEDLRSRGMAHFENETYEGARYYLEAAAERPEADSDPRLLIVTAVLARDDCRLDDAWHRAERARVAAKGGALAPTIAELLTELEATSGVVRVTVRLERAGSTPEVSVPRVGAPEGPAPAPAVSPWSEDDDGRPVLAAEPGAMVPEACLTGIERSLSTAVQQVRADEAPVVVGFRLPVGRYRLGHGVVDVGGHGPADATLALAVDEASMTPWLIGGAGAGLATAGVVAWLVLGTSDEPSVGRRRSGVSFSDFNGGYGGKSK